MTLDVPVLSPNPVGSYRIVSISFELCLYVFFSKFGWPFAKTQIRNNKMKILQVCMECSKNSLGFTITDYMEYRPIENSSFYEFTCHKGHTTYMILQNPKYQILFESALNAHLDGYYREAVTSFAVALERFYEFSIIALLKLYQSQNKNNSIQDLDYKTLWNPMSKQTERQIGAFYSLYFLLLSKPPLIFNESFMKNNNLQIGSGKYTNPVKFRNEVTHQGYIPNQEEALEFGEAVNKYIQEVLVSFNESDPRMITDAETFFLLETKNKYAKDKTITTSYQKCFIDTVSKDYLRSKKSLKDHVKV